MWFWQEKLGTGTGSWPSCLAHWSAVDSPPKTPENSVPSAARWLPSILFVLQSVKMALWYGNRHNAASRSSQEWGQHLARGFSCTHRARWRVEGSSTGIHRELAQPSAAWSLLGWTSFHSLIVSAFHCLQAGGRHNFDLWELSLAKRLCILNTNGMGAAAFPVLNILLWVKRLLFCILLLLTCFYTATVIGLSVNLYFKS